MAGDRIYFDHDFPEKPEVLALAQHLFDADPQPPQRGVTVTPAARDVRVTLEEKVALVMLRFHRFWRHFDRHIGEKFAPDLGPTGVSILCGGDASFWRKAEEVGWVIFRDGGCEMPGFAERLDVGRGCAYKRMNTDDKLREKARERQRRARLRKRGVTDGVTPCVTDGVTDHVTPPVTAPVISRPLIPRTYNQEPHTSNQEPSSASKGVPSRPVYRENQRRDADATRRDAHLEIDWEGVRQEAIRWAEKGRLKPKDAKDRELLLKVVALRQSGKIAEHALADSIEALRTTEKIDKRWGLFWQALEERVGPKFRRLLARVTVPEELLRKRTEAAP